MQCREFSSFRLIGGTGLSLQIGHRISVDINMFTDSTYGFVDFVAIDKYLRNTFAYVSDFGKAPVAMGVSYSIGNNELDCRKLDQYYTDEFIRPVLEIDKIRMATVQEIIAMKIDVIQRKGRKKNFWDLHELIDSHPLRQMISLTRMVMMKF